MRVGPGARRPRVVGGVEIGNFGDEGRWFGGHLVRMLPSSTRLRKRGLSTWQLAKEYSLERALPRHLGNDRRCNRAVGAKPEDDMGVNTHGSSRSDKRAKLPVLNRPRTCGQGQRVPLQ